MLVPRAPVEKAHAISEEVEQKLKRECKKIEVVTIHIEPAKIEDFKIAIPIEEDKGLESASNTHFGSAPYFIFVEISQGTIKRWFVKLNPGAKLSRKQGITTAKFLITEKATTAFAVELGEGPFHVLKDNLVEIYSIQKMHEVNKILDAFLFGNLEKMLKARNA
jgi:predicted Fe-Mo cluster-binding NifX family protein